MDKNEFDKKIVELEQLHSGAKEPLQKLVTVTKDLLADSDFIGKLNEQQNTTQKNYFSNIVDSLIPGGYVANNPLKIAAASAAPLVQQPIVAPASTPSAPPIAAPQVAAPTPIPQQPTAGMPQMHFMQSNPDMAKPAAQKVQAESTQIKAGISNEIPSKEQQEELLKMAKGIVESTPRADENKGPKATS